MVKANDRLPYRILVVDDEKAIRMMLVDFLENRYELDTADTGENALEMLKQKKYDLVISDINMPGMSGPELLKVVRKEYKGTKTALITAYNIDEYITIAKEYEISNIIPKTVPFNFAELDSLIYGLLTGDIFGLDRYLLDDGMMMEKHVIKSSRQAREIRENIISLFVDKFGTCGDMKLILDEIITNAIYHAPLRDDGTEKYQEFTDIDLEPQEYIYVECGYDREKYAVSVTDLQGRLTKDTVLYKIDRQITGEGLLDDSGRGLHMSRLFADRLIINIAPNRRTEVILINYFANKYRGYKPLYINEL
ncbi:MAG: response regulator [Fibrobacter sp.]|jgi:CheY-like chemotaxis protein|nr:response regulator [Fibrobacter sp.]